MTVIETKVEDILTAPLSSSNYNIVRVKLTDNGSGRNILQIMIERQDGQAISIADCEKVNRLSSVVLDVENLLNFSYVLEVSSPGVDRPLTKITDYQKYVNHEVRVNTAHEINGRKKFKAMLQAVSAENELELLVDEQVVFVPYNSISSGNLIGKVNINKRK